MGPEREESERAASDAAADLLSEATSWLVAQAPSRAETQSAPDALGDDIEAPPEDYDLDTTLGGALRLNLFYKTWAGPATVRSSGNNVAFDTFRLDVESGYGPLSLSAEYRFYAGYNMLHHGWLAYRLFDIAELKVGLIRVPFGPLPYASNNYFFNLGFYVGLEDDHDLGGRVDMDLGVLDLQLAYFRNDEGSYSGSSIDSARYSYDVVRSDGGEIPALGDGGVTIEEQNQVNARATATVEHAPNAATEVGLSGQIGQLTSGDTEESGHHWAAAAHARGRYGPVGVLLEAARYAHHPPELPGRDDRWMVFGAFDAPYRVASEAYLFAAGLSYRFDLDWEPIDSVTLYEDYSRLAKLAEGFTDTQQNTTGALISIGPLYTYLDVVLGRSHPWIGPNYLDALAEGAPDPQWEVRLNTNVGYYF